MPPKTPEVIAHRGASRERPENTVAAFTRAAELGADAVELDVHLTSDGVLVVHHDPTLAGPGGKLAIGTLTLAAVREFRVRGEPVPTLQDVVAAVGGRLRIYCELKGPGTAAPAMEILKPLGARAAVHSFDHRMIAEARRLAPDIPRGVLEASYHVTPTDTLASVAARDLWQADAMVDQALVDAVHTASARLVVWTVNDPGRARELAAMGVDGLCTDDVAAIKSALSS